MTGSPYDRRPVADPAELGIDTDALDELFTRVQVDIDEGRLPSCQVALARDGQVEVWRTFGARAGESRYVMFSATKAVVAGAVWMLIGDGVLDVHAARGGVWSPSSRRTGRTSSRSSR